MYITLLIALIHSSNSSKLCAPNNIDSQLSTTGLPCRSLPAKYIKSKRKYYNQYNS